MSEPITSICEPLNLRFMVAATTVAAGGGFLVAGFRGAALSAVVAVMSCAYGHAMGPRLGDHDL